MIYEITDEGVVVSKCVEQEGALVYTGEPNETISFS